MVLPNNLVQFGVSTISGICAETVDGPAENADEAQTVDIYRNLVFMSSSIEPKKPAFSAGHHSFWLIFPRSSLFLEV